MALLHYLIIILVGLIVFWILRHLKHGKGRGIPGAWDHLLPINRALFDFMFYPKDHLLLDRYVRTAFPLFVLSEFSVRLFLLASRSLVERSQPQGMRDPLKKIVKGLDS